VCLRNVQCHVVSRVETVLIGPDVLKILGFDPVTLLESRQATLEIKEIVFPHISPGANTHENEGNFDLDDDVPFADELSETDFVQF